MTPALSIIIVSYNTREMTLECLRSVFRETLSTPFEVIVLDNDSSDGSADGIESEFAGRVALIRSKDNLGFARANNVAAERARGEYLLLLNPDTVVLDSAIDKLVAFARSRPEAGIWGGRTLFGDRTLNPTSCWRRQTLWSLLCHATGASALFRRSGLLNPEGMGGWARDSEREVDIVTGCFFLIERALWERLGGFDPAFFMYGEEADLCLRARRFGARPRVTPRAEIIHYGGASERVKADKLVRLLRAKAMLIRRHWPAWKAPIGVRLLAAGCLSRTCAAWCVRPFDRAASDRVLGYWGAGWSRRKEWMEEPQPGASGPQSDSPARTGATADDRSVSTPGGTR
ncbi:MAG: glycosyltransferase family 2 protein [Phycisphaerales bacterium]|nr:MAG: glycosyltransferase family 2 protein [Phycisphaerales bacterium]